MKDNFTELDDLMIKYNSALKVIETQLEIINDDFKYIKKYNPIEHIKTRIKSKESIINKLKKYNLEFSIDNIQKYLNDIVGVRIICAYKSDVYDLINILKKNNIINVIQERDYLNNQKGTGYRSYHLIVEVPLELIDGKTIIKAEIQIRTLAMDLWASLEHKLKYKSKYCTNAISNRLIQISDELNVIDEEMNELLYLENKMRSLEEIKN